MCTKCTKVKTILYSWLTKREHDKCWYYPELFKQILDIYEIAIPQLPDISKSEFEYGCREFIKELYHP